MREFFYFSFPRDIITNRSWRLYRQPPHKTFHRVQIEIEFMFEFCADCQYHHVPIFVLHGYRTFVPRLVKRLQCHASSKDGAISKELSFNQRISVEVYIRGNNTQIKSLKERRNRRRDYNLFSCHFLEEDDDDVVGDEVTKWRVVVRMKSLVDFICSQWSPWQHVSWHRFIIMLGGFFKSLFQMI